MLEHIFYPYFTTNAAPHPGAGLHRARATAGAGGGEVAVFSPNSDGLTQFTLALPLFDPTLYEEEPEEDDQPPETETAAEE